MDEDSCEFESTGIDRRNNRAWNCDGNKRLNHKEELHRHTQAEKRNKQRQGLLVSDEEVKQEFDEVNERYRRQLEEKKRAEAEALKKNELFLNDLVTTAAGPIPKRENKKVNYEEKVEKLKAPIPKQKPIYNSSQRAQFLAFLQNSLK